MATKKEVYNEDELEPPKWINEDFVCSVLQTSEKNKTIKVKSLKITPATLQGDHYASIMFRARVEYQSDQQKELQSMSIIIKTMPEMDGTKKGFLEGSNIFETEVGMYNEVMPKLESILQAAGDNTKFAPRCLYGSLSPKKVLVFEDIVPKNYQVCSELGLEEVKAAFIKLAKMHAVSYKIHQENPKYFEKFQYSLVTMNNVVESELFTTGIDNFIEMLDKVPSLLKYKPYFVALHFYFSNFEDTLRQIDYKGRIPKLIEFKQMLLTHRHFDIYMLVTILPITSRFFGGDINPEDIMTNANFRKSLFTNKHYIEELEECLPRLLHMGYLDN